MATIKTLPDGTPYAKDMTYEEWEKGIALGKMQSSDSEWTKEDKQPEWNKHKSEWIKYRLFIGEHLEKYIFGDNDLKSLVQYAKITLGDNEPWVIFDLNGDTQAMSAEKSCPPAVEPTAATANDLLEQAAKHMRDRAATYDAKDGAERSMAKTVELFNILCGQAFIIRGAMCESQGWLFMALLKMVRSETKDAAHRDSIEDLVAYASLYGEARLAGK